MPEHDQPRRTRSALPRAMLLASVATASACGGGGGGGAPPVSHYWVSIDPPSASVAAGSIELYGTASCDACPPPETAFGGCPTIHGPFASGIDVYWSNLTTGASDAAFHAISGQCGCFLSYCTVTYSHKWMAIVPLAIGPNEIELVAVGPTSEPGTETVTVVRTPAAPQNVAAVGGRGEVAVSWDPVVEATSYSLHWSTAPDLSLPGTQRIDGVLSPYLHSGLADDVTCYYAVTASSGGYESPLSAVAWATPGWTTLALPMAAASWQPADTSIATDALDGVHVHTSRIESVGTSVTNHNEYATDATGAWISEAVATPLWADADVAVDSQLEAHVGYIAFQGLTHAVRQSGAWNTETVDAGASCHARFALDPLDRVHLAYRAVRATPAWVGELCHATNASGAWQIDVVDAADLGCGSGPALLAVAAQADGTAHVAYVGAYPGYGLQHAVKQGGTWSRSTIEPGYVRGLSLALDSAGTPRVAYSDVEAALRIARRDGSGAWIVEDAGGERATDWPSLAIDASGAVHVSYWSSAEGGQLRYATDAGGSWRVVRVAPAAYADTALALDSLGRVHVAYFAGGACMYATNAWPPGR